MKKITLLILALAIFACNTKKDTKEQKDDAPQEISTIVLDQLWASDSILETPEAVLYDVDNNLIYVANMGLNPKAEKDNNGFISRLSTEGEIIDLKWVSGLNDPKGMGLYDGKLYVTDIDEVVEIDQKTGEVLQLIATDNAQFLNDLAIDDKGTVYFTDSRANEILMYKNGEVSSLLKADTLNSPNGLMMQEGKLLAVSFRSGHLFTIDLDDVSYQSDDYKAIQGDGIVPAFGGLIISGWSGQIYYLKNQINTKIQDTKAENIQAADIDYIVKDDILLVPTFGDNRVMAYKVSGK